MTHSPSEFKPPLVTDFDESQQDTVPSALNPFSWILENAQNDTILLEGSPSSKKERFKRSISQVQTQNLKARPEVVAQLPSRMRPVSSAINVTPQRLGLGDHVFIQSKHPAHVVSSSQIFTPTAQSKASAALKHQVFIPSKGTKTFIIGVGMELPSQYAYDTLFNCINKLPSVHRKKWDAYIHKPFDFTIRSSLVLYDKFGFVLKGGNLMKRKESNVFEYERRRGKLDTFRLLLNKDGRCCIQRVDPDTDRVMQSRKRKASAFLNRASMALQKVPSTVALQMLGKNANSPNGLQDDDQDVLFVKNDITEDIEQLRIKIVDPKEIHHMVLVLHFDAPMNLFLGESCPYAHSLARLNFLMKLMPKLRPYVRVIDAERKLEIMRYYIDDLPKMCVALEMNRVPYKPHHDKYIRGDLVLNRKSPKRGDGHRPQVANEVDRSRPASSSKSPTSAHITVDGVTMRHKKVGENVFVLEQATPESPVQVAEVDIELHDMRDKARSSANDTLFHVSEEDDYLDDEMDDEVIEEIVVTQDEDDSERYSWTVIPLRQEWQFVPKNPIAKEQKLGAFLYHADLNTFGIPGNIPQLPLYWKLTIHEGRSLEDSVAYVVVGSNSIHHTQKHTTKPLRTHRWGESFKCAIERGYRAGGIFMVVMKKRTLRKDKTVGRAHLNFGIIKRPYDLDVNPSITTWIPVMKGLTQHGELKVSMTLIYH